MLTGGSGGVKEPAVLLRKLMEIGEAVYLSMASRPDLSSQSMTNMKLLRRFQQLALLSCFLCWSMTCGEGFFREVVAGTIYSYIDDQGTPVYTDALEKIPDKYRAKVKVHQQPDPVRKTPSVLESVQRTVKEQAKNIGFTLPSFQFAMDGLNPAQSKILTYAGAAALVLLLMMYFSKSQMMRTLGFCLLIVVGIGAPVLMYVSEDGPMDAMKKKAVTAGQAQQDRLQQTSQ